MRCWQGCGRHWGEGALHHLSVAKAAERNDSNVHTDVARMEELGLIERTDEAEILVPYEAVEIVVPLARAVA